MKKGITVGTAQIEPRFILWQKVRYPLAAAIVAVVLLIVGIIAWSIYVSRHLSNELDRATELAATDTIDGHRQALALLERLEADNPDNQAVHTHYAWQQVLMALRFGTHPEGIEEIRRAVERADPGEPPHLLHAARAGLRVLEGDATGALEAVDEDPAATEVLFVKGLALARAGRREAALPPLDKARRGPPPFLPALTELAVLLRESGRYDEAGAALKVLGSSSPNHEDAIFERLLLELDRHHEDPAKLNATIEPLAKAAGEVEVDASMPRLLASQSYAEGRLDLYQGRGPQAAEKLALAAEVFDQSPPVATWLARAYRRSGEHVRALEALAPFPDDPATDRRPLKTRAEILMDLWRTTDAAEPWRILLARDEPGAAYAEGLRLLAAGDPAAAVPLLERALEAGDNEAAFDLAEAHVRVGHANKARTVLRRLEGTGPLPLCASGYQLHLKGQTRRAMDRFKQAHERGGRCGAVLAGRLLVGTGNAQDLEDRLVKALDQREDLRVRVSLGRVRFRTSGHQAARRELDKVRRLSPQAALVLRELALAYDEMGLREEAAEVAREGIERTEGHPLLVSLAARYDREAGALDEAEALLERALKTHPEEPRLLLERANLLFKRQRISPAREALEQVTAFGPLYADAVCLTGRIQFVLGERQEAQFLLVRAADRAAGRAGVGSEAQIRACHIELQLRRGRAGLTRAKTALHFLTRMPILWAHEEYLAGLVAERENRLSSAEEHFRRALELDPANRGSWDQLAAMGRLTDEDRERFELLWPGQSLGLVQK